MKLFILMILFSIVIGFSCERVEPVPDGELKRVNIPDLKGVPLEFGSLIAVTRSETAPGWGFLWFEDDEKTIRMVRVKIIENRIAEDVIIISRY